MLMLVIFELGGIFFMLKELVVDSLIAKILWFLGVITYKSLIELTT